MHVLLRLGIFLLAISAFMPASAQRVALKTNTLDWLSMSPNLSMETRMSRKLTFQIGMAGSPFSHTLYGHDSKFKNIRIEPSLRYWFNRPMARNFVAINAVGGAYDLQWKKHRIQGSIASIGASYGYALVLSRHWNVEFSAGIGLGRAWGYDWHTYETKPDIRNMNKWTVVPSGTAISFSYIFD